MNAQKLLRQFNPLTVTFTFLPEWQFFRVIDDYHWIGSDGIKIVSATSKLKAVKQVVAARAQGK